MTEPADITPVILAAGASSRMGQPKALLDFDGRTCLEIALESVRGLGTPVVVLGAHREQIQSRVRLGSVQLALNEDHERGEVSSLKAGLSCLAPSAAGFLLRPVDFPLVSSEEVDSLVGVFLRDRDADKALFVPSYGMQRGYPVLCRRELADEFLSLPDGAPLRTVIGRHTQRICHVGLDQSYVLMDMDTPADYQKCLEAYRIRQRRRDR